MFKRHQHTPTVIDAEESAIPVHSQEDVDSYMESEIVKAKEIREQVL